MESIDKKVTDIRLKSEKKLAPAPTPYKNTYIGKRQVAIIRLIQTIQRRFQKEQDSDPIRQLLRDLEVVYDVTPTNLPSLLKEELQYLKQIQQDIGIHRDEQLQAQAYAARIASKTETEKAKIDEHKERASVIIQMRNRERQHSKRMCLYIGQIFFPIFL